MASNKEKIVEYIQENGQATVAELDEALDIERVMIHRHLKALLGERMLEKVGKPPKVFYISKENGAIYVREPAKKTFKAGIVSAAVTSVARENQGIIEENFLLITPAGERLEGVAGFARWCEDGKYDIVKKAAEYVSLCKKYSGLQENGLLDGTQKMRDTFGENCAVDRVHYIDFYAWEIFGKTKLGQLLLYAKQSQDRKMIKEITEVVRPHIGRVVEKHNIEAVGYIPPTVKRSVQLMEVLEKNIGTNLPELKLEKVVGEVRVPQKTLSKLEDRVQNARATIFVTDRREFGTVLLIDDAIGSGATLNEVARKLKDQGVAKKVIGLAVVGSLKGFDVISEV